MVQFHAVLADSKLKQGRLLAGIIYGALYAWEHAVNNFPQQLTPAIINLMKAYTINEINHYDRFDWIDDVLAIR